MKTYRGWPLPLPSFVDEPWLVLAVVRAHITNALKYKESGESDKPSVCRRLQRASDQAFRWCTVHCRRGGSVKSRFQHPWHPIHRDTAVGAHNPHTSAGLSDTGGTPLVCTRPSPTLSPLSRTARPKDSVHTRCRALLRRRLANTQPATHVVAHLECLVLLLDLNHLLRDGQTLRGAPRPRVVRHRRQHGTPHGIITATRRIVTLARPPLHAQLVTVVQARNARQQHHVRRRQLVVARLVQPVPLRVWPPPRRRDRQRLA